MVLVLQSFGQEYEYRRAIFTIYSFFAHAGELDKTEIILFTDKPEFFANYLNAFPVRYVMLTPQKIKAMRGEIDFLHRMKIALIEESFELAKNENLLYIDSDAFFITDARMLDKEADEGHAFMHKKEYDFASLAKMRLPAAEPFHAILKLVRERQFQLADGKSIRIDEKQYSWNAGAMFFHHRHKKFLPNVYRLTEQLFVPSKNHASEQYAFSVILQNSISLLPLDKFIFHYWYRIEKKIVDEFFLERINGAWAKKDLIQKLADVKNWTNILPRHLATHILMLRDRSIQAFHENKFSQGYYWAARSVLKRPFNIKFIKDLLYHTKRALTLRRRDDAPLVSP